MPCCGDREKIGEMKLEQTWDYINLNDFKSTSCFTGLSYFMVWFFLGVSIAVYAVDTFTAVNLLAFNKWSSQIKPKIPFKISRWIFAGCIIASFVLLVYRWIRAIRVMRSGGIAESYLDPLAARVQSIRLGKSKGYRRFIVFTELTKSKKGADYVALFVYLSFESWLRVCFADGPRQVINAITLYSVMKLDLIPTGSNNDGSSSFSQFFTNLKALAEKNYHQTIILVGMLFTLIIWVIAVLSFIVSITLYLIFLWHHIPTSDGTLKRYCQRKINTRLDRIVRKKTATALAKGGMQLQDRTPTMPMGEGDDIKPIKVAPTLPSVAEYPEDKKPIVTVAPLSRQPTQGTLPPYSSEPVTYEEQSHRQPRLPDLDDDGALLTHTNTQNSAYGESASLAGAAAPMGYSPLDSHHAQPNIPDLPPAVPFNSNQPRSYSPSMNRPPMGPSRPGTAGPMPMEGMARRPIGPGYSQTPPPPPPSMGRQTPGFGAGGPPGRPYSPATRMPYDRPYSPATNQPFDRQQTPQAHMRGMHSNSPAINMPGRSLTPGDRTASPRPPNQGTYVAFNPSNINNIRSESPSNDAPSTSTSPPHRDDYFASDKSNVNDIRPESPESVSSNSSNANKKTGYVAFNPFSSPMDTNDDVPSQPSHSVNPGPITRPSTAGPSQNSGFQPHPPIVRAATTTPTNGYGRHEIMPSHAQQSHPTAEEEDDDEYDPLSYYGSAT